MSSMPCLAVEHRCTGTNKSTTTVFSVAGKEPIAGGLDSDELTDKAFCPTPQGWLIVRDRLATDDTYLLDHHSHEKINLPPLEIDQDLLINCSCLLSDAPTAPGCVVLIVEPDAPIIRYHRIGQDDGWTEHEYDIGTQGDEIGGFEKIPMCETVACRGKFYFLSSPTELGVLELSPAGPAFSSIPVDGESYNYGETAKALLVESEEELYMVRLLRSRDFNEANVYKMDFSEQQWRPVHDLGGRAFFVAPLNFGVSCSAGDQYGIQQNCVYSLVKLADKSFNMFNVEDGTAERRDIGEAYVSVAKHGINPQHPMGSTPSILCLEHSTECYGWFQPTSKLLHLV